MVTALIDSAVIIDLLRGHSPALSWLEQQPQLGATPIVWLEVIEGARDLQAQRRAVRLLSHFERIPHQEQDFEWAIRRALAFRLSHNVDVMDCLIASCAYRLDLPLYSTNLKHFTPLLGPLAHRPY